MDDLQWLSQTVAVWDTYFQQTSDIDASNTQYWNGGVGFSSIGNMSNHFSGTYYGSDHIIDNLYINVTSDSEYASFVGESNGATIGNLGLTNVDFSGPYCAGLVTIATNTNISNCYTSGNLMANSFNYDMVGGISVMCSDCVISNCYSYCNIAISNISGGSFSEIISGGFTASAKNSTIIDCFYKGDLSLSSNFSAGISVAGFAAEVDNSIWKRISQYPRMIS